MKRLDDKRSITLGPPTIDRRPALRKLGFWALAQLVVLTALGSAFSWGAAALDARAKAAPVVDASTAFELSTLDGASIGPRSFPGKLVVLDFWTTWCGPCRAQAAILDELHGELGSQVAFLAINVAEDQDVVRKYVTKNPFPYPVLLDPQEDVAGSFNVHGFPTLIVLDPQGKVVFRETSVVPIDDLRTVLKEAGLKEAGAQPTA
jgi:thiol-disulfide isomerase/thioredoxin